MVRGFPSALAASASSMAPRMACDDSGRRDDGLGAGEGDRRLEAGELADGAGLDEAVVQQLRDQRRGAVVAQAAGVDAGRHEVVAERVHLDHRRHPGGVAEVEVVDALGQRRAGGRLDGQQPHLLAGRLVGEEGEGDAGEVGAAAVAGDDDVRVVAGVLQLLLGLQADDGLVQADVVEHRAERVAWCRRGWRRPRPPRRWRCRASPGCPGRGPGWRGRRWCEGSARPAPRRPRAASSSAGRASGRSETFTM